MSSKTTPTDIAWLVVIGLFVCMLVFGEETGVRIVADWTRSSRNTVSSDTPAKIENQVAAGANNAGAAQAGAPAPAESTTLRAELVNWLRHLFGMQDNKPKAASPPTAFGKAPMTHSSAPATVVQQQSPAAPPHQGPNDLPPESWPGAQQPWNGRVDYGPTSTNYEAPQGYPEDQSEEDPAARHPSAGGAPPPPPAVAPPSALPPEALPQPQDLQALWEVPAPAGVKIRFRELAVSSVTSGGGSTAHSLSLEVTQEAGPPVTLLKIEKRLFNEQGQVVDRAMRYLVAPHQSPLQPGSSHAFQIFTLSDHPCTRYQIAVTEIQ